MQHHTLLLVTIAFYIINVNKFFTEKHFGFLIAMTVKNAAAESALLPRSLMLQS
jgi:hypothetical protein